MNRRVWTRQPQVAVGVDWSNPITRGLIELHSGATGLWDASGNGRNLTKVSVPTIVAGSHGLGFKAATSAYFKTPDLTVPIGATNEVTLLMLMIGGTTSDQGLGRFGSAPSDNMDHYPGGGTIYSAAFSVSRWLNNIATQVPFGTPHVLTIRAKSNIREFRQNGLLTTGASAVSAPTLPPGGTLWIGSSIITGSTWFYSGHSPIIAIWNRYLSNTEESILSRSLTAPWQLFTPLSRPVFAPSAAATSIYTLSNATYQQGSITAYGVVPQVDVTVT